MCLNELANCYEETGNIIAADKLYREILMETPSGESYYHFLVESVASLAHLHLESVGTDALLFLRWLVKNDKNVHLSKRTYGFVNATMDKECLLPL